MFEQVLGFLREIGLRKAAVVGLLAGSLVLVFRIVPEWRPHIWIAIAICGCYLVVDLAQRGLEMLAKSRRFAAPYRTLDDEERAILRLFVDEHSDWLYRELPPLKGMPMMAIHRLIQRNYLFEERDFSDNEFRIVVRPAHWLMLLRNPRLVGSSAKPRIIT